MSLFFSFVQYYIEKLKKTMYKPTYGTLRNPHGPFNKPHERVSLFIGEKLKRFRNPPGKHPGAVCGQNSFRT